MNRISLKVTGAQGQGVNSVGEMLARGLKDAGYCVFGYREYMSLIKGGHSSYQLDISDAHIGSSEQMVNILVCFNHHGLERNIRDVKQGGIVLHQTLDWEWNTEDARWLQGHQVTVVSLPTEQVLHELKAPPILGNTFLTAVVWSFLQQDCGVLESLLRGRFGRKGERVLQMNIDCLQKACAYVASLEKAPFVTLPATNVRWSGHMLLTGSQAMGFGIIHAGCRVYAGYPMTPSSPLLSFLADMQNRTRMVIKQAEDEITAVQMASGAMHMGARAMTATSGGGFDLMTETLSMNGIIENPIVIGLAMRPGPGTGLPTWTAQGDLLLAVHSGHGEFPRCVLSVSDAQDAFDLMPQAFNLAEQYQMPVIVLFDKHIAEALYTQEFYDQEHTVIERHLPDTAQLQELQGADRYAVSSASGGVSPRWLPGTQAATYCAQSDEHSGDGSSEEGAQNASAQMDKRMHKLEALAAQLPEPELFTVHRGQISEVRNAVHPEVLFLGWGSTKGAVLDALLELTSDNSSLIAGYLHYTYLWPLKTDRFSLLSQKARQTILIEGNKQGQLGMLLRQQCGIDIPKKILKYDGRPFCTDELHELLSQFISPTSG